MSPALSLAQTVVIYSRPETTNDVRAKYPLKLLDLALQRSGKHYILQPSKVTMLQSRAMLQLQENQDINIMWTTPSPERDKDLLRIPVPIDKGLVGWRLLLVKKERLKEFGNLKLPEQLRAKKAGQGHDWPDTDILRANQFTVDGIVGYASLFKTLEQGSIDYFPRSVVEIWPEAAAHPDLAVEPTLLLHYPDAFFFYVSKSNQALADDLSSGLEKMIADGSFDANFHTYYDPVLSKAHIDSRRVVELRNPLFPDDGLPRRESLWFRK